MSHSARRPLGRILVEKGVISEVQLHHVLAYQRLDGRALGEILIELGMATADDIARALSEHPPTPPAEAALAARARELDEREARLAAIERDLVKRERQVSAREALADTQAATRSLI
jgi:hypothetical protein